MTRDRDARGFDALEYAVPRTNGGFLEKLSGFGLFATVLLSIALGLTVFCVSCFLAILSVLIYNQVGHHAVNFADTYKFVALPAGSVTTVVSFIFLFALWIRRRVRA